MLRKMADSVYMSCNMNPSSSCVGRMATRSSKERSCRLQGVLGKGV